MRTLVRLAVVVVTILTLSLVAAVGVSASAGKLGSANQTTASILTGHSESQLLTNAANLLANTVRDKDKDKDKDERECHDQDKHEDGTPGHKHHPCKDEDDGDTD
jgi:hypothetical protein